MKAYLPLTNISRLLRPIPRDCWQMGAALLLLLILFLGRGLWPAEGTVLGGHDIHALFYPWLTYAREALADGRIPWWDPHHFAGYPFLSNPQLAFFYPPTWLALLLPVRVALGWYVLLHLWLGGMGIYLLVRSLHQTRLGALLAALTFTFNGFMVARLWAGHVGLIAVHTWLPWLLLALWWAAPRRSGWYGVVAGLPLALAILAGHTTSLLYLGLIWACFGLYLMLTGGYWGQVLKQMGIAIAMALLLSAIQLLPLLQFIRVSSRSAAPSFEFATAYSFPPAHLLTLLVPVFFGEPLHIGYWSVPNFEELTAYAGLLPLLALFVLLRRPRPTTWLYGGLALLGLLLALGSYGFLYQLFYDWLPPFRLVRAPGRAMFLYVLAASLLVGALLSPRTLGPDGTPDRSWRWLWGGTAVALFTAIAATGAVFMVTHPTETSGRLWHQVGGWSAALLVWLMAGWLWHSYTQADQTKRTVWAVGLALLVIADLWLFGLKFMQPQPVAVHPIWQEAKAVLAETDARVLPWGLPIFEQNGAGQVGLASVFGYNALEIGANVDFTGSVPDPRSTAYDILSAAYVISPAPQDRFMEGPGGLHLLAQTEHGFIYERPRPFPLVRLFAQVEVIPDRVAAIARVHQPDIDVTRTAIVDRPPDCDLAGGDVAGTAVVMAREPGYWRIETNSAQPSLLVLSETAYPGWRVTINGQQADWLTAYTAVRAVCLPAGDNLVEWRFVPTIYGWGGLLSLLGVLLLLLAWHRIRWSRMIDGDGV
jgi:hypothetical protein